MSKFDSFLQDLTTYLKLPSLPVAVKMLRKGEKPPVPAKYPLQHFKKGWSSARPGPSPDGMRRPCA